MTKAYHAWYRERLAEWGLNTNTQPYELMKTELTAEQRAVVGLAPHHPAVVTRAENLAREYTGDYVDWARSWEAPEDWDVVTKLDWRLDRKRSRGGVYSGRFRGYGSKGLVRKDRGGAIHLAAYRYIPEEWNMPGTMKFQEYKSFCRDPGIGDYECADWQSRFRLLIIHECSHALQLSLPWKDWPDRKGHGPLWKHIYRAARRNFGYTKEEVDERKVA